MDFYKLQDLDTSLVLNYPSSMSGILSVVTDMLNSKGKLIATEDNWTVSKARELVSHRQDLSTYFLLKNVDAKIWSVLRDAIENDRIRVLGIVHGTVPEEVPTNVMVIDIGRSIQKRVTPQAVADITSALSQRNFRLSKNFEAKFQALQALCFESLYSPEATLFPKSVARKVPRALAFRLMFNPPTPPTEEMYRSAVLKFIRDVRG